jgi:putative nucleotidyltransferase with HDIG domain
MFDPSDLLSNLKELPAMPNIIMRALNIMKDPDSSLKELAKIVSYDQSLSTKVLTLVNSSYYGFPQQITSMSRAISLIGMSKAKNLILTVAMRPMMQNQGDKELWKHSIMTAIGCEYIAKHLKVMDVDEAFVIGFLHDLGKIVLNGKDSRLYEKVKETVACNPDTNLLEVERTYFGADHCQMGSILTKRWQLPLIVNNTVKYHHTPGLSSMPTACSIVNLVDLLVKEEFAFETLNPDVIKNLNIQPERLEFFREEIFSRADVLLQELST